MITPLTKLKKELTESKLDAILISSISNITYLTGYSGFSKEEREAYIFIVAQPIIRYVLTDGRYSEAVKTLIPAFKLIEISSKFSFEKALKDLVRKNSIKHLGFEGHNISFLEHKKLKSCFNDLPAGKAGLNHLDLANLRTIKTPEEILKIEKACKLGDKTFTYILKKIKLGISEKELAFEIEFFIKRHGADISFPPIVAFGPNSAIPHHVPSDKRLATSDKLVLLDFGVKLNNYCSDMTRTVFFGNANTEFKKMYNTVLQAQSHAIDLLNSLFSPRGEAGMIHDSIPAKNIDKVARDYIVSKGYKTIPHSLGHGIGIEVHESPHLSPKSKDILKEGMVFSIEPGIYLKGFGGVRIEDVFYLGKNGLEQFTHSPKDLNMIPSRHG